MTPPGNDGLNLSQVQDGQLQRIVIEAVQLQGQAVRFTPQQQHYLYRVLRLQVGDRVLVMDGQGHTWLAELTSEQSQATLLTALELHTELLIAIHLWIALPKGSGFEEIIRQATEVGVTAIHPLYSDRTLLQPSSHKRDRWRRIAEEAAEQSERQTVVEIAEPVQFLDSEFCKTTDVQILRYLAVTRQDAPHFLDCLRLQPMSPPPALWIATGPEGGWSAVEVEQAIVSGVTGVSLGRRILRAVTAPIVAASLAAALWESQLTL